MFIPLDIIVEKNNPEIEYEELLRRKLNIAKQAYQNFFSTAMTSNSVEDYEIRIKVSHKQNHTLINFSIDDGMEWESEEYSRLFNESLVNKDSATANMLRTTKQYKKENK